MDNRNITSITVNYDNGDSESFNKGIVINFEKIDNEDRTVKVCYHMCDIKGCELEMVVESIISLANKIGMFEDKEN